MSTRRGAPVFYAKPYPGRFTDYVPKEHDVDFVASPVLAVETDHVTPQQHHSGHMTEFRTRWQGSKSLQRLHDYSYGKSDPAKRPEISTLSDLEWLASLHKPTRRWLALQNRLLLAATS